MTQDKISNFLKTFASCFQLAKMYGCKHPEFDKALNVAYQRLQSALDSQEQLIIAIVGNELTSGDEIFFDLSKKLSGLIETLTNKGCEKLIFEKGLTKEELKVFFSYFLKTEEKKTDLEDYLNSENIKNIQVGKLKSLQKEKKKKEKPGEISADSIYSKALSHTVSSLESIIENGSINIVSVDIIVESVVKGLGYYYQEILKLSKLKGKDVTTFSHLLNVSFLAVHFSKNLGFPDAECRKIGMASLFHDIGKLYISNKILKGGKLEKEEFEQIKSHSLLGATLLLNYVDKIGKLAPVVALEHHLRFDSSGYPKLNFPHRLHFASMLVSLCDVYDALSQRRSYKNNFPPELIYEMMKKGRGSQFHPEFFDLFFKFIGVWPNGTIVLLSNDKVARVQQQNPDKIFSPKVKIVSDSSNQVVDLSLNQLNLEIKKSLDPYAEGKKYFTP